MSEIDAFPRAVLAHHYPEVPLHGDFTTIGAKDYDPIDILVGGTPCQSFSVAGLRGGMADERGNLALEYLRLAERLQPKWLVWENVPGVLSSEGGRDFGSFVGGMAELGYGWAYRILDAQYAGLAQRRKRVFVVGHLGDWRRAAAVLFEPASLRGDSPPSRKTREDFTHDLASSIGASGRGFERAGETRGQDPIVAVAFGGNNQSGPIDVATAVNAHGGSGRMDGESETFVADYAPALSKSNPYGDHESREGLLVAHSLRADGFDASEDGTGRGTPLISVAFAQNQRDEVREMDIAGALSGEPGMKQQTYAFQTSQSGVRDHETHATLDANNGSRRHNGAIVGSAVRRLTSKECCRLQGFPDDYLDITYRGKPAAYGNKYKALGNSMAVPVMAWIGRRLMMQG